MVRIAAAMLAVFGILAVVPSVRAQWGDLTGTFVYDGPVPAPRAIDTQGKDAPVCNGDVKLFYEDLVVGKDGGLANVVVYVRSKNVKVHESYQSLAVEPVVLDNKDCQFVPHVVAVWLEQTLVIKNPDPITHNSKMDPLGDTGFNSTIQPQGEYKNQFKKAQTLPQPVNCTIHPWMQAHVVVRDNPYVAVTDAAGKFTMKNLPEGELEFQAWHEKVGFLEAKPAWKKGRFTLKMAAGKASDLGTIKVSPALFKK